MVEGLIEALSCRETLCVSKSNTYSLLKQLKKKRKKEVPIYTREKVALSDLSEIASCYPNHFCVFANIHVCTFVY